jgi:hypothetical protein
MSEKAFLLEVSPEERERILTQANQRGYPTAEAYLRALIEADAEPLDDPAEGFRQAWHEIMAGNTRPISELWEELKRDE